MPKPDPLRDTFQILKPDGTLANKALEPKFSKDELLRHYKMIVLVRILDDRMYMAQRQGRIGFYVGGEGEETAHVAAAAALRDDDFIIPSYREMGAAFMRGLTLRQFMAQLMGNSEDLIKGRQMPCHIAYAPGNYLSVSSPVGTQIPQATGLAWALKHIDQKERVAIVFFGEGASSEGSFHAAANFAGVFKAPVIFFCRNNQYAISVPLEKQTASETIAVKALAYGIEGIRVDGNDFLAVYHATKQAAKRARAGKGPTLLEAHMYRYGPHTSSDDPRTYRSDQEVKKWARYDGLPRLRKYLERKGWWSREEDQELHAATDREIVSTFKEVEKLPPPPIETMFEEVYAEMPWHLREQMEELQRYLESTDKKAAAEGHG
ncbi:MAG: pyruvate dehydrogenase (acetyl-transferring) E1 component subunit alpha [Acidobacteriota bacterium]|nr:MAG: pyruvate dehydrogenase (acetyl-transferring) E1 component subunit alpha [Acidobacteriota bacterium]